jgi:glutathione S-transferase
MKIWHDARTRSLRGVWMAEEMDLDYVVVPGEIGSPALLAVNSSGTLPAFEDGDVTMSESIGIIEYLAGRYGPTPLVPPPSASNYAAYLQFLWLGEASLAAPATVKVFNQIMAPPDAQAGWLHNYMRAATAKRLTLVSEALNNHTYIAGEDFTAADISVFYALNMLEFIELPELVTPQISAYRDRIKARPAYQRALSR